MAVSQAMNVSKVIGDRWLKGLVVIGLAAIAALTALPHYLDGQWPWSQPLEVPQIEQLQALKQTGITLPEWTQNRQQILKVNGHDWNFSEFVPDSGVTSPNSVQQFGLLLRPQPWHSDQPTVEWVDLKGAQGWQINQRQSLRFQAPSPDGADVSVQAQYYRAWNKQHTFAVLQWYAWPTGGSYAPGRWFWADQRVQWHSHQRLPWVAVSLLIPIEPLGQVQPYRDGAIAIGRSIQTALMAGPLAPG